MQKKYDVALSFAGEDRKHAKELADLLKSGGFTFFYDRYEQTDLWGKNLYVHLSSIYKDKARYCVVFLSKHYAIKPWPRHELESAQARAINEIREYILPVRLDDTEIEGILPTVGYLDLREVSIEEVYQALAQKLSGTPQIHVPAATSISTEGGSTKNCCRDCHFLAKYTNSEDGQTYKWTWNAKERSDLQIKDHYGAECVKGIWSAGIDPEINSRLEEELLKDRKDECFFFEFDEATKSMTFDAATELLRLRGEESHRIQQIVEPIEQVSEADPLSTESAVASLKHYLSEHRYRLQLEDLINDIVSRVLQDTSGSNYDLNVPQPNTETVTDRIRKYEAACATLIEMALLGGRWGEREHVRSWQGALQRLTSGPLAGGFEMWVEMRRYPATLLLYALGVGAVYANRLDFLSHLFSTAVDRQNNERNRVTQYLAPDLYFNGNTSKIQILEGMSECPFPLNDWVQKTLRHFTLGISPDDDQYTLIFDKLEILISLNSWHNSNQTQTWLRPLGCFMYRYETSWNCILPEIEGSILRLRDESPYVKANLFGLSAEDCWRHLFAWYNWLSQFSHPGSSPFSAHPLLWGKRVVNTVEFGDIRVGDPSQFDD